VGKKKQPMYRIVVADSRSPRDGRFVESIGVYHPLENPSRIELDSERAKEWLDKGATPSDRVAKIFAIQGIREIPVKLQTRIALGEERKKQAEADKAKAKAEAAEAAPAPEAAAAPTAEAAPAAEAPAEEATAEQPAAEAPAAEQPAEEAPAADEARAEAAPEENSE
jgi:small subunit ribosomal protein S16